MLTKQSQVAPACHLTSTPPEEAAAGNVCKQYSEEAKRQEKEGSPPPPRAGSAETQRRRQTPQWRRQHHARMTPTTERITPQPISMHRGTARWDANNRERRRAGQELRGGSCVLRAHLGRRARVCVPVREMRRTSASLLSAEWRSEEGRRQARAQRVRARVPALTTRGGAAALMRPLPHRKEEGRGSVRAPRRRRPRCPGPSGRVHSSSSSLSWPAGREEGSGGKWGGAGSRRRAPQGMESCCCPTGGRAAGHSTRTGSGRKEEVRRRLRPRAGK